MARDGEFDVIVHACNLHCVFGGGIAAGIKSTFPEAYEADCKTVKGDHGKLGTFSFVEYGITNTPIPFQKMYVLNGYMLNTFAEDGDAVNYDAVRRLFGAIKERFSGKKIGYPMLGTGIAGGNWEKISAIINEELQGEDHTLVIYNG